MKYAGVVFTALALLACDSSAPADRIQASPAITVKTITMTPSTLQGKINVFGVLESAEQISLNVEFSAPVEKVLVDEGQTVTRLQPLLLLDTSKLALSLKHTQHKLEQAIIQQENAHLHFSRLQTLAKSDSVSQQHAFARL